MQPGILIELADYLNTHTLPGKSTSIGEGVVWTVKTPHSALPKDIGAILSQSAQVRPGVGLVMPQSSQKLGGIRGVYDPNQPRGGALREMSFYLTIFTRSLKPFSHDGEMLLYEDLLQELLYGFSSEGAQSCILGGMNLYPEEPDQLVLEFDATLQYTTISTRDYGVPLKQIILELKTEQQRLDLQVINLLTPH